MSSIETEAILSVAPDSATIVLFLRSCEKWLD